MRKITLAFLAILVFSAGIEAQLNFVYPVGTAKGGAITAMANDWEAIGISPSNLGWENNNKISFTILNIGISAQADLLTVPNVEKIINNSDTTMLERIASSHSGLNIYGNFIWAAFSIKIPKVGGIAISISDRAFGNITMSPNVQDDADYKTAFAAIASTAFTPQNAQHFNNQVNINTVDSVESLINLLNSFSGSSVSMYEFREINLDYGRKIVQIGDDTSGIKFYGGFGVKYIIGLANLYGQFVNGTVTADYAIDNNPGLSPIPSNPPGSGFGVDLSASMAVKKWKFAVSVTDLGSINWTGTHATIKDTFVVQRIIQDRGNDSNSNNVYNYVQTNGEKFTTQLPSKFRIGASYDITNKITVAGDMVMPLNNATGNLIGNYYSIAGHFKLAKVFTFDVGFATAKYYGTVIPIGISVGHKVQFYLGVNDLLTYLGKESNTDLSAAVGLIRVNL